jgi:hypothetical protein
MTALAFGFVYLILLAMGFGLALMTLPILKLGFEFAGYKIKGLSRKTKNIFQLLFALVVFFLLFKIPQLPKLINSAGFGGFIGFYIAGCGLHELLSSLNKPVTAAPPPATSAATTTGTTNNALRTMYFLVLFLPLVLSLGLLKFLNEGYVLPSVGLRMMDVTLRLSEENYSILASAAGKQHLAVLWL